MGERIEGDEAMESLVKKMEDEEEQTGKDDNPGSSVDIPVLKLEEEKVDSLPSIAPSSSSSSSSSSSGADSPPETVDLPQQKVEELAKALGGLVVSGEFSPPLVDDPCESHLRAEELEVSRKTHLEEEHEQGEGEETTQGGTPILEEFCEANSGLVASGEFSPSKEIKEEDPPLMDNPSESHLIRVEELEVSEKTQLVEEQEQCDVEEMSQRGTPISEEVTNTSSLVARIEEVLSGEYSKPNESRVEDPSLMHDPCETHPTDNLEKASRNSDLDHRASWISCCGLFDVIRGTRR